MQIQEPKEPVLCSICNESYTTQTAEVKTLKGRKRSFPCCLKSHCRQVVDRMQYPEDDEEMEAMLRRVRKLAEEQVGPVDTKYAFQPSATAKKKMKAYLMQNKKEKKSLLAKLREVLEVD